MYKRIIIAFLSFALIVNSVILTQNVVKAQSDTTPPSLNSISVDKNTATGGDNVSVTTNATDDISGVKYVDVTYVSPSKGAYKTVSLNSSGNNIYTGSLTININDEAGTWKVDYVCLGDNAGNEAVIYNSEMNLSGTTKDLSSGDFQVTGTQSDTTPPSLNSISVDKKTATGGDNISVTTNATDDISGVKYVDVTYVSPSKGAYKTVSLNSSGNNLYTGSLTININDEAGTWKVDYVCLGDNVGNEAVIYNSEMNSSGTTKDLSSGDFQVTGTQSDTTPPSLNSISVDKKTVAGGDNVSVTTNATDDMSGVKYVDVTYVSPSKGAYKTVSLNSSGNNIYTGSLTINKNDEAGTWKVDYVCLGDNVGNEAVIYNSEMNSSGTTKDLSSGDFQVTEESETIQPLPQKCVTQNDYWTGNVINGDLYIGPKAVLTINGSVTVNGNIYVFGAIKNYGNLTVTGGIYAQSFVYGNSDLNNGTVLMLGGTNNISSMVASDDPIDVPIKIYEAKGNTLIAYDNKLSITGATLPVIDLYEDNNQINYNSDGTFSLNLNTENKGTISFQLKDVFGNIKTVNYNIVNKYYDTNGDNSIDIQDLANVAKEYNSKSSSSNWKQAYDYNNDGIIDIYDLTMISKKIASQP